MVKKRNNSYDGKAKKLDISGDDPLKKLLQRVALELERGNGLEAMSLFAKGQAHHILATTPDLPRRLVDLMGMKMADKLIAVFVHSPCPFCNKGRVKCENCDGHGHIDYDMVCVDCMSLGLVTCDFCDGSGWRSIDSIPVGLRAVVLSQRMKAAINRIKRILSKPVPLPSQDKPLLNLKKCAELLIELNRYIGVLENTVVAKSELTKSNLWPQNEVNKMMNTCTQTAIAAQNQVREIIKHMAAIARTQAEKPDQDSTTRKLANARVAFYRSLVDSSDIFAGTNLEHPFLNEAVKKLDSKNNRKKENDEIIF